MLIAEEKKNEEIVNYGHMEDEKDDDAGGGVPRGGGSVRDSPESSAIDVKDRREL